MALGFTSHYKQGEQAFGSLTQSAYTPDTEAAGTVASSHSGIIVGQNAAFFNKNINYDSCDFSSPVVIDYTQYASIAEGGGSVETAGALASAGSESFSGGSVASFSAGGAASFSGGGGGSGGVSCASFTC